MGGQSAIILAGSPHIGKSALINYLEDSSSTWSWRKELAPLGDQLDLDAVHFVQIDLTPLETETMENMPAAFQSQCAMAVQSAYHEAASSYSSNLTGLRKLLRQAERENPRARYFVMLDSIERLGRLTTQSVRVDGEIETDQDRGLALLQQCGALRTLIDLNDEFLNFGIILSIETLPRPSISHQFSRVSKHLSDDLARFTTMMLKTFSWEDAIQFLKQGPESFGSIWAEQFKELKGTTIFSDEERFWLLEKAGTHPYFLQQFCFYTFNYKQKYAHVQGEWTSLEDIYKRQIIDTVKERLSTFLTNIWNRLQQALEQSHRETSKLFYDMLLTPGIHTNQKIAEEVWNEQKPELRYILANEGIICYDGLQHVRYPGEVLLNYLIQEAQEINERTGLSTPPASSPVMRGLWVTCPGSDPERLDLSDLEYRLLHTLLQHPEACTERTLMECAWGKEIERSAFTQRMHHLRKKLKKQCGETEIIENRYGGQYLLSHPEWFRLI
ncbi:MAG: helix-turn-helix domain-containing protein [Chloroflexi bacterium]|nr:helix-turn-helix domain-containing protein [Chloroflexota bacterium]